MSENITPKYAVGDWLHTGHSPVSGHVCVREVHVSDDGFITYVVSDYGWLTRIDESDLWT